MKTRLLTVLLIMLSLTGCALTDPSPTPAASGDASSHADASVPADRRLALALAERRGVTVAVASDSTGALDTTWTSATLRLLARDYPDARMTFRQWDSEKGSYEPDVDLGQGSGEGVTWLNAAVVGSRLETHRKHLAQMYPQQTPIDVLIINMGHNYQMQKPAEFEGDIDLFLGEFTAAHPETSIMLTTQNPQFSPTRQQSIDAHAVRQEHLVEYGREKNYPVLNVFDVMVNMPDGGQELVGSDGLHPRMYETEDLATLDDQKLGAVMWAHMMVEMVRLAKP